MLNKKIAAIVAASGMAVAGLAVGITPAKAFDPVSNSYVVVGSDTLEDVVGALANGTSVTGSGVRVTTSDSSTIASFDATGSGTIITKPNGIRFQRPNGSGDGRKALESVINNTTFTASAQPVTQNIDTQFGALNIAGQVDISRGSSGGTVANDSTGVLARYTFGRDAIAYAYGSALTGAANIDLATMKLIFQCDPTTLANYGITSAVIPQSGSGTRKDFLGKLGITDNSTFTSGACIKVGQEHDASGLLTTEIMPMSASRWIAMQNGVSYKRIATGVQLGSLVAGTASVSGTAPNMVPVVAYYKDSTWGRDTYLFVDKRRVAAPASLTVAADAASGSTVITLRDASGVFAGQSVTGTGIASNTTVSSVSGNAVTLSKATTAALTGYVSGSVAGSTVNFVSASYDAVLNALFDYTNETSLTYQGGSSFNYDAMSSVPSFGAYTAAAVKLKFGFLPASVQDKQFAHN